MSIVKVCKFGGTSMANATAIKQSALVVQMDANRRFVVVSAPGKRQSADVKVTDLLYKCHDTYLANGDYLAIIDQVRQRFLAIASELGVSVDLEKDYQMMKTLIAKRDFIASRGEYLCAKIFARYLDAQLADPTDFIFFDKNGDFDAEKTNSAAGKNLLARSGLTVIPGFYGVMPNGDVKTFTRGGSDFTGSIVARAVSCALYENFTDVDGFMACDPRIVPSTSLIDVLTYKELRELSYMGANVLHPDSIFPVRKVGIAINIRNTFNPSAAGTMIVPTQDFFSGKYTRKNSTITGIAGKKHFAEINLEKSMMNNELGFARKLLEVLESNGVSVEHLPTGIDTMGVVFDSAATTEETIKKIVSEIDQAVHPDRIEVVRDLALIAIVGHGMFSRKGTAAVICNALERAGVNICLIDQGSSELNVIIAVSHDDYHKAITALYQTFFV